MTRRFGRTSSDGARRLRGACETGQLDHRRIAHLDLPIAAAAESAGLPLLHYDGDFDAIAAITGQLTRWIAPRGSIR